MRKETNPYPYLPTEVTGERATREREATEKRNEAINTIQRYLQFVPVGTADMESSPGQKRRITCPPELREQIITMRGQCCEACQRTVETRRELAIHHLNYYRGNDPAFLAVVCHPCHGTITQLSQIGTRLEGQPSRRQPTRPNLSGELILPRRVQEEIKAKERAKRPGFEFTCRNCAKRDTVPFRPRSPEDMFCRDCFKEGR